MNQTQGLKMPVESQNINYAEHFFNYAEESFVILNEDLVMIKINDSCLKEMGVEREQVLGKSLYDIRPGIEKTERFQKYMEVMETGKPVVIDELRVRAGLDAGIQIARLRIFKIGNGIGICAEDITDLKTSIKELEEARIKLEQKNTELEEVSFITAHDLMAPLTNLESLLDILLEENSIREGGEPVFTMAQEVVVMMRDKLRAINEVIFLKSNFGESEEELFFDEVLDRIKDEISGDIKKSHAVLRDDFSMCDKVSYNSLQLQSIIENLVTNAIKYRSQERDLIIDIRTSMIDGKVVLEVTDNGVGINEELNMDKLFGLFKKLHTYGEGLGTGLYVVKSIVTMHGGHVEVVSQENSGTTFKVYLQ